MEYIKYGSQVLLQSNSLLNKTKLLFQNLLCDFKVLQILIQLLYLQTKRVIKHFFLRLKYFLQDEGCFPCGGYALCYGFTILEVHGYRTDKAYDQTDITELGSPQPTRMPQSAAIFETACLNS